MKDRHREAGERQIQREQAEEEERLQKPTMKEIKASKALLNKLAEEKRVERERVCEKGEGEGKTGCKPPKSYTTVSNRQQSNLKQDYFKKQECEEVHR
jgi:hypothetical protein